MSIINNWSTISKGVLLKSLYRLNCKQDDAERSMKLKAFQQWLKCSKEYTQTLNTMNERQQVIDILMKSKRGHRTACERVAISKYLRDHLFCIPKTVTDTELDVISNDIDVMPTIGRSILFLQGDYGNVYYMIARGSVGLYVESNRFREKSLSQEYGHLRSQCYEGDDDDLKALGDHILTLHVSLYDN